MFQGFLEKNQKSTRGKFLGYRFKNRGNLVLCQGKGL
jgi:hypothetical protein